MYGENVLITYLKGGGANPSQLFFQSVQSLTPKYFVTNNLMQVTNILTKQFLFLNDREAVIHFKLLRK